MILLIHIAIALTSIVVATALIASPSKAKLKLSYGLIAGTIASGTALIVLEPAMMLRGCSAGLTYITIVTILTALGRNRVLALETTNSDTK